MSMAFWRSKSHYIHKCKYNLLQKVVNLLSEVDDFMFCCLEQFSSLLPPVAGILVSCTVQNPKESWRFINNGRESLKACGLVFPIL